MERRMDRRFEGQPPRLPGRRGFGASYRGAWVYLQYPWVWSEFTAWFRSWVNGPTMLPLILAEPIALFFTIMGGWGIVEGAIRTLSGTLHERLGNIVGGAGGLPIAYMIGSMGKARYGVATCSTYFIMIMGATIILSAVIGVALGSLEGIKNATAHALGVLTQQILGPST